MEWACLANRLPSPPAVFALASSAISRGYADWARRSRVTEYSVVLDHSNTGRNDPDALTKKCNEMAHDGWRLVSTCAITTGATGKANLYLFFERQR